MKRLRYETGNIDKMDDLILEALTKDARITVAQLAREVGMSSPSVSERIKRLEEAGVIKNYTIAIDPKAMGYPITAWLRIRPIPGQLKKVVEILQQLPEIVECDRITGEDCFLARTYARTLEDLEVIIDKIIPYATTTTSLVQSSPVKRRYGTSSFERH